MSTPEFDSFLQSLTPALGLKPAQKTAIVDELRDHLEERFHQLTDQGRSREEACRQALAEFGDTVALAQAFTVPQQRLQRRQAVRYTLTSVSLVITTFVMASFYWPVQRPESFARLEAQAPPMDQDVAASPDEADLQRAEIEDKLQSRDIEISFVDTPFADALTFISDALDVDVLVDKAFFEEEGVDVSAPINLKLRPGKVSVKTALRMLLRQINLERSGAVVIRDGYIDITRSESSHEVQVYNCRDLLDGVTVEAVPAAALGQAGGGAGMFQIAPELLTASIGQLGGGGLGGGLGTTNLPAGATSHAGTVLMYVLQQATQTEWLDVDGVGGTITEFNGLITIGHTQQVHERVEEILKKMRTAHAKVAAGM